MHRGNTAFKIRLKNAYSRYKNIFNYLYISLLLLQKYRNIYVKKEIIEFFGISNIFLPCNKTRHNQLKKGQRIKKTNFVACWSRGIKKKKNGGKTKTCLVARLFSVLAGLAKFSICFLYDFSLLLGLCCCWRCPPFFLFHRKMTSFNWMLSLCCKS